MARRSHFPPIYNLSNNKILSCKKKALWIPSHVFIKEEISMNSLPPKILIANMFAFQCEFINKETYSNTTKIAPTCMIFSYIPLVKTLKRKNWICNCFKCH
mgnify:CR=1 FL=1